MPLMQLVIREASQKHLGHLMEQGEDRHFNSEPHG